MAEEGGRRPGRGQHHMCGTQGNQGLWQQGRVYHRRAGARCVEGGVEGGATGLLRQCLLHMAVLAMDTVYLLFAGGGGSVIANLLWRYLLWLYLLWLTVAILTVAVFTMAILTRAILAQATYYPLVTTEYVSQGRR